MKLNKKTALTSSIDTFDQHYKSLGMSAQRSYPNESLIQFLASRFFKLPFEQRKKIRVMEVGCGSGANLWMMSKEGFDVYGIDSSEEGISLAKNHLKEKWKLTANLDVGSFTKLPYRDAYFDIIADVVSLQHLNLADSKLALSEIIRVMKPGSEFFSYRLSDHSIMFDAGNRVDSATLENISDTKMPLSGSGPISFWSPNLCYEMYGTAGLQIKSIERVGRTYSNGMFVEYLAIQSKKK